jgi:ubiquinone/menaquinone biosynthesis C-methylase UbiE
MFTKSKLFFRNLYYSLSPKNRFLVRKIVYFPSDFVNSFSSSKHKIPKKGDIFIGSGDYVSQGNHQVELLKQYANLQPEFTVLDVGSGIGRTAYALQFYLNQQAKYDGFDVVEKGVKWCKENISKNYSNFNFKHVSLHNDLYVSSTEKAEKFQFPYNDDNYNTVFLFSVFTHMQPKEVQNYLNEIHRVLKVNGKCLATFFYYSNSNEKLITENNGAFIFPYLKDGYRLMNEKVTSANIAFSEEMLMKMIENSGLNVVQIIDGTWKNSSTTEKLQDFQDVFVLEKKA